MIMSFSALAVAITSAVRCFPRCQMTPCCNNQILKNLSPPTVYHADRSTAAIGDIAPHDKLSTLTLYKPELRRRRPPGE